MSVLTLSAVLAIFFLVEVIAFILYQRYQTKNLSDSIAMSVAAPGWLQDIAAMDSSHQIFSKLQDVEKLVASDFSLLEKKFQAMEKVLAGIPSKTLNTIQGSVNNTAGKLGEMMALLELQQQYDRLIVSKDIVDFIGIKFPTEDAPGCIHFIDVKTGKSASLSQDQRKLKSMFPEDLKHFAFKVVQTQVT